MSCLECQAEPTEKGLLMPVEKHEQALLAFYEIRSIPFTGNRGVPGY